MKQKYIATLVIVLGMLACSFSGPATATVSPADLTLTSVASAPVTSTAPPTVEVPPTLTPTPADIFGRIARSHMEALTVIGARVPGSPSEQMAAQYILAAFQKLGYTPQTQAFSAWDKNGSEFKSANVFAVKQGDSPKEIMVGAHYDSGNQSLGADDNASGVGVLLEAAERMAQVKTPYTIRFIAFGSEENDLDGSNFFVARMTVEEFDNTIAMINLDSLAAGDITYVYSGEKAFLRDWVLAWAGNNNMPLQTIPNADLTDGMSPGSDYGAFEERGIPFIYFEATNWALGHKDGNTQVNQLYGDIGHIGLTKYDNLEYIDATFPGRVDEHLRIFVSALAAIFTEFKLP